MIDFTYDLIFQHQLEKCQPLTEDSEQIKQQRTDYFDDPFQVGDQQLFVQLVRNKYGIDQNTSVEFVSITPRSWETLLHFYVFEPHYDSRTHQVQMNTIPRFVQKPMVEQTNE